MRMTYVLFITTRCFTNIRTLIFDFDNIFISIHTVHAGKCKKLFKIRNL